MTVKEMLPLLGEPRDRRCDLLEEGADVAGLNDDDARCGRGVVEHGDACGIRHDLTKDVLVRMGLRGRALRSVYASWSLADEGIEGVCHRGLSLHEVVLATTFHSFLQVSVN